MASEKLIWLTGPPGVGKSTIAQLLMKDAGFIYYEGDCFSSCRDPFVSSNVDDLTWDSLIVNQKLLEGEDIERRKQICEGVPEAWQKMVAGQEYGKAVVKAAVEAICHDIKNKREMNIGD